MTFLTGVLICAGANLVGGGLAGAAKANKMDAKALKRFGKAYEQEEAARKVVETKMEETDFRIMNCVRKKKAILEGPMQEFLVVYKDMQKIEFIKGKGIDELEASAFKVTSISQIGGMVSIAKRPITDKEAIVGLVFNMYGSIKKDSERFLEAATKQESAANVLYEQAELVCVAYDNIIKRADKIADVMKKLNFLFTKSVKETRRIIVKNGINAEHYTQGEMDTMFVCVNLADAVVKILNVPILDEENKLQQMTEKAIEAGIAVYNKYMQIVSQYN